MDTRISTRVFFNVSIFRHGYCMETSTRALDPGIETLRHYVLVFLEKDLYSTYSVLRIEPLLLT